MAKAGSPFPHRDKKPGILQQQYFTQHLRSCAFFITSSPNHHPEKTELVSPEVPIMPERHAGA
jgi:hypothetical protein